VHWDDYGADHKQDAKTHGPLAGLGNGSWHTYGLKWSPTGYQYYFDDALLWTSTAPISQRPEYLILSSEVRDAYWAGTIPVGGYGPLATSTTNVQVNMPATTLLGSRAGTIIIRVRPIPQTTRGRSDPATSTTGQAPRDIT